jgi:hypothetical protein
VLHPADTLAIRAGNTTRIKSYGPIGDLGHSMLFFDSTNAPNLGVFFNGGASGLLLPQGNVLGFSAGHAPASGGRARIPL